jgi:hypothetical protein
MYRILLLLFLFPLSSTLAHGRNNGIHFRYVDNLVWVDVRSEATAKTFHFLLDSGAGATILDTECARQLKLKLGRPETVQSVVGRTRAWKVRHVNLIAGNIPLPSSALVVNLSTVERTVGKRIDGLIGIDFFERRAVQLDYRRGQLRVFDHYAPRAGATVIPLRSRNSILCAKLKLNDIRSQWLRVDTGCSEALHWAGESARRARGNRNTTVALTRGKVSFQRVSVQCAGKELGVVRAGLHRNAFFKGEDGLLGNGLLSRYRVTIDARRRRLILE